MIKLIRASQRTGARVGTLWSSRGLEAVREGLMSETRTEERPWLLSSGEQNWQLTREEPGVAASWGQRHSNMEQSRARARGRSKCRQA